MERINKGDFTTLEELKKEIDGHYTSEEINLLHKRRESYLDGSSKSLTVEESLKAVGGS